MFASNYISLLKSCFKAKWFIKKRLLLYFVLIGTSQNLLAQNLDKLNTKDALKISGGINASAISYSAIGIEPRREPFSWFLSGNVTASIADFSLPFTYSYSSLGGNYSLPFNIVGATPTYKWVKGYIGYTNMDFSSYSLAGHLFLGAGVELKPEKSSFRFATMYGKLRKAVEYDELDPNSMSFDRLGYGTKIGFEKAAHSIYIIGFHSKDKINSLKYLPINSIVKPQENLVASIIGKTELIKHISIESEYALSALTLNLNSDEFINTTSPNYFGKLYNFKSSTSYYDAFKSSIGFKHKFFAIKSQYERVDPGYITHGAYFFNNDIQNITIAPSFTLLKGKINLSANTGFQKNNLENINSNSTKRWIGSFNLSSMPTKKLNLNFNYSNFTNFTKIRPQNDLFYTNYSDTLNFYQVAQQASSSINYQIGNKQLKQNISVNFNYQVSAQNNTTVTVNNPLYKIKNPTQIPTTILNSTIAHSLNISKKKIQVSSGFNYNRSEFENMLVDMYGPTINLSKSLIKNTFKINSAACYNLVKSKQQAVNSIANYKLGFNYTPKLKNEKGGKPSLGINFVYVQRMASSSNAAFSELTGNANISYSF